MSPDWDFTAIARYYANCPDYAPEAIETMMELANVGRGMSACDIGAGTGRMTLVLMKYGFDVIAIEPNAAMRAIGEERTSGIPGVEWVSATGEDTGQPTRHFSLVTFASSFHTMDRARALLEAGRIVKNGGWFACLWNHRDLNDDLQSQIEDFVTNTIPGYSHGIEREDQSQIIQDSGFFSNPQRISKGVRYSMTIEQYLDIWRADLNFIRQAGDQTESILSEMERILQSKRKTELEIPFNTRIWMARSSQFTPLT